MASQIVDEAAPRPVNLPGSQPESPQVINAIVSQAFGAHPQDVLATLHDASDSLLQLASLFRAIACCSTASTEVRHLAALGALVAEDTSNGADLAHEDYTRHLSAAGLVAQGGG